MEEIQEIIRNIKYLRLGHFLDSQLIMNKMNFDVLRKEVNDFFNHFLQLIKQDSNYTFVEKEGEHFRFNYGTNRFRITFSIEEPLGKSYGLLKTFELTNSKVFDKQDEIGEIPDMEIQIHQDRIEFTQPKPSTHSLGVVMDNKTILPNLFLNLYLKRLSEYLN